MSSSAAAWSNESCGAWLMLAADRWTMPPNVPAGYFNSAPAPGYAAEPAAEWGVIAVQGLDRHDSTKYDCAASMDCGVHACFPPGRQLADVLPWSVPAASSPGGRRARR